MQVVAVTDPLELGFARQAMVGIRVTGPLEPVADALAALDEVDYVVITAGSYDLLVEVVCESDEHLLELISGQDPHHRRRRRAPRRSCTSSCASRPTRGVCAEPRPSGHDTAPAAPRPAPAARRRPRRRRRDRRRRASPGCGPPTTSPRPTRRCGSPCSRPRPPGSAPRGRNGGWCSALFPASLVVAGRAAATATAALAQHARDAGDRRRGRPGRWPPRASTPTSPRAARSRWPAPAPSWPGPGPRSTTPGRWGRGEDDLRLLDADEARAGAARRPASLGATYTPDCAAIHPLRLVRGLADAVERARRHGPRAHAGAARSSPAGSRPTRGDGPGRDRGPRHRGLHRRPWPGERRTVAPGLLADHRHRAAAGRRLGRRSGCARRETFSDHRHLIIYGQRTADDRLVFGGRGAPYHFGSRIRPGYDRDDRVFAELRATLVDLFPVLARHPDHPRVGRRARHPARLVRVGRPRPRRPGSAGPAGTSATASRTTNLAGRTLRDLVLGRDTELTRLPWVGHRSRPLGARAAALARHQRRAARDDLRRRRGAADPPAERRRAARRAAARLTRIGDHEHPRPRPPPEPAPRRRAAHPPRPGARSTSTSRCASGRGTSRRWRRGLGDDRGAAGRRLPGRGVRRGHRRRRTATSRSSARPGADERKPETAGTEETLAGLGYRIDRIEEPGTLDGGDVLKHGGTVWVGLGGRTNQAGVEQLAALLAPLGATRGRRTRQPGAAPEVRGHRAARRHRRRLRAARRRPGRRGSGSCPCPRRPGSHVVLLGGDDRADGDQRAAQPGALRGARAAGGGRRHLRVREARGLRDLPVGAAALS